MARSAKLDLQVRSSDASSDVVAWQCVCFRGMTATDEVITWVSVIAIVCAEIFFILASRYVNIYRTSHAPRKNGTNALVLPPPGDLSDLRIISCTERSSHGSSIQGVLAQL